MSWDLGDTVPLGVTIVDDNDDPIAAGSVTLTITGPDGTVESGTTPTSPTTGRYEYDFVPTVAGIYQVLWQSTAPATTGGPDAVDVRPPTNAVVSLADLRAYLNKAAGGSGANVDDEELRTILAAGVERVTRHLGRTVGADGQITQSEVLAVKLAAAEFWRPQRAPRGGLAGGGISGGISELDSGPGGSAPLTVRLTELLGPAVGGAGAVLAPAGAFPDALDWPDAICLPL